MINVRYNVILRARPHFQYLIALLIANPPTNHVKFNIFFILTWLLFLGIDVGSVSEDVSVLSYPLLTSFWLAFFHLHLYPTSSLSLSCHANGFILKGIQLCWLLQWQYFLSPLERFSTWHLMVWLSPMSMECSMPSVNKPYHQAQWKHVHILVTETQLVLALCYSPHLALASYISYAVEEHLRLSSLGNGNASQTDSPYITPCRHI